MKKLKIVVVEDHIRYREAIVSLLNKDNRFHVIAETSNGNNAIMLATQLNPDIILMDVKLDGKSGIDATREIKQQAPNIKIIGLSLYNNKDQQEKMFAFGASAYLDKRCSIELIMSTIIEVKTQNNPLIAVNCQQKRTSC